MNRRAWLELVRLPNLSTVPGDPLCGYCLAIAAQGGGAWPKVLPVVVIALLLYMAGLLFNDCADLEIDRKQRPERPIPSGRVALGSVVLAASLMVCGALGLALTVGTTTFLMATALLALVLSYDFVTRRIRWIGLVNMGACRGASVLLGASAAGTHYMWAPTVLVAAVGITLYITAVSRLALSEVENPGISRWIGLLIRLLIPVHAGLCALSGGWGWIAALVLLSGWPISSWLAKRFYAS